MEWKYPDTAAAVRRTTDLLHTTVEFVEQDLAYDLRRCVPNALLNIAVARLMGQEGRDGALKVLTALVAAVASGADPAKGPVRVTDTRQPGRPDLAADAHCTANVVHMR